MRIAAARRWAGVVLGTLGLAALGPLSALAAETSPPPSGGERAWLGVYTQALTSELREGINYRGSGVLVNRVIDGSPADKAGIKKGDVITSVNSRTVDSPDALSDVVGQAKVGQTVSIRIARDGKTQTLNAKLAAREEDEMEMGGPGSHEMQHFEFDVPRDFMSGSGMWRGMGRARLGVRVESLNPDLGSYFSVPDGKGVLVVEVMKGTPADKAGLKAGDVITKVGTTSVADGEDLVKALGTDEGKVSLGIVRKGSKRTVDAELEKMERVVRVRRGDGAMGYDDGGPARGGAEQQRQIDELRRQVEDLRKQLEKLQHD